VYVYVYVLPTYVIPSLFLFFLLQSGASTKHAESHPQTGNGLGNRWRGGGGGGGGGLFWDGWFVYRPAAPSHETWLNWVGDDVMGWDGFIQDRVHIHLHTRYSSAERPTNRDTAGEEEGKKQEFLTYYNTTTTTII